MKQSVVLTLCCMLLACDGGNRTPIPDMPVLLDINLIADAPELQPILGYKTYTQPRKATERLGYGGILVYHTVNVESQPYVAFDLACPHEAQATIRLRVLNDGTCRCDSCSSVFMLSDGTGFAISKPAHHRLKKYSVLQSVDNLYIRN